MICCYEMSQSVEVVSNLRPRKNLGEGSTHGLSTLIFGRTFSLFTTSGKPFATKWPTFEGKVGLRVARDSQCRSAMIVYINPKIAIKECNETQMMWRGIGCIHLGCFALFVSRAIVLRVFSCVSGYSSSSRLRICLSD